MLSKLEDILKRAVDEIDLLQLARDAEGLRIKYLGKKGELTTILRGMGALLAEERPAIGAKANEVRAILEAYLKNKLSEIEDREKQEKLLSEKIDVSVPGPVRRIGKRHPVALVRKEIEAIFISMGFAVADGPEVEYAYYNFDALNTPLHHPARDMQDTFYFSEKMLLRTQTSSTQARYMEKHSPPLRMICPGAAYRYDDVDATHSPFFHQIEGLIVDEGVGLAHLKGVLTEFARLFFGSDTRVRFRPHHFPFTEPSAEMDVSCFVCKGSGCRLCKGEGFIEILGAGVVHPNVLTNCGIDPEVYSGYAFGMGQERLAMLRYEIDDMRLLFENDARFLRQF